MNWQRRRRGWLDGHRQPRPADVPSEPNPPEEPAKDEEGYYAVTYFVMKCPRPGCGSKKIICYKSRPPVRYHLCQACNTRFKSVEGE